MKKNSSTDISKLSASQRERLKYIEYIALLQGMVNREDITTRFNVSAASATNDISMYNELAPANLTYNIRLKCYEISESFASIIPIHTHTSTERLPLYTIPRLFQPADTETIEKIALISRAIQKIQSLNITYSSASSGMTERQIVPVAFADNSLRWHLRAYDRKRAKFSDFVVNRIGQVEILKNDVIQSHEYPNKDKEWNSFVKLKITAHSANLTNSQSFNYGDEPYVVEIRAAMAGYFLELWNVDCSPDHSLRGRQYQYVLLNLDEISEVADLMLAPGHQKGE